ncbi:MAG: response regulator, partial [Acidimicrobiales bacterium]
MTAATISLLLVDDHEIVRRGLTDLFEADGDIAVVGQAGTVAEALVVARRTEPQVAVLDVRLPDGTGIELCRQLKAQQPDLICVMLTSFADDHALVEAADAGAAAYLLKEVTSTDIVAAIRKVADGAQLLDDATVRLANRRISGSDEGLVHLLSPQERRIFDLIGAGYPNRQIAAELYLAEKTVKNYVTNMLAKLAQGHADDLLSL